MVKNDFCKAINCPFLTCGALGYDYNNKDYHCTYPTLQGRKLCIIDFDITRYFIEIDEFTLAILKNKHGVK